ncbi:40S ribosomal protein S27-like [Ranunculus cassubicifolius]
MVLSNDVDLLNPPPELEKKKHKLKRLVQSPNSFYMFVKCKEHNTLTVLTAMGVLLYPTISTETGGRGVLPEILAFS